MWFWVGIIVLLSMAVIALIVMALMSIAFPVDREGEYRRDEAYRSQNSLYNTDPSRSIVSELRYRDPQLRPRQHHAMRCAGFCINTECQEYNKSSYLSDGRFRKEYICIFCGEKGEMVPEAGSFRNDELCVRSVRVEFRYDVDRKDYRGVAIVIDNSLQEEGTNVYELKAPLVLGGDRGLRLAEDILIALQKNPNLGRNVMPSAPQVLLCFDLSREQFEKDCQAMVKQYEVRNLTRKLKEKRL